MKRRIVITGMGMVTPLGHTKDETWKNILASQSGIGPITLFDASSYRSRIGGEVKNFKLDPSFTEKNEHITQAGRNVQFAITAATEAFHNAKLELNSIDPLRFGVYLGSGEGAQDFFNFVSMITDNFNKDNDALDIDGYMSKGLAVLDNIRELEQQPNMVSGHLAYLFNAQGLNSNCLTACAASSQAIGEAAEVIWRGDADVMLTGGTHSMLHPFGLAGFNLLTALSTRNDEPQRASRPFDKDRDGFILSEGAGILVLEELEHARARNAPIYAELIGYGNFADAYRVTDVHPEGRGAIKAINKAIKMADISYRDIDYINTHGTSTLVNDRVETLAIKETLKEHAYEIGVSSTKSMLGHLIAAAGAVELIMCCFALRDQVMPPTINYETPDPDCDLDYVPNKARPSALDICMSTSLGFGGQNIALIVRKFN